MGYFKLGWEVGKKLLKSKKGGVEAITGVKPSTKFKGSKTVDEIKRKAAFSRTKAATFSLKQTIKETAKKFDKLNKTIKKQKKTLDK
jgi:hypothetical protein